MLDTLAQHRISGNQEPDGLRDGATITTGDRSQRGLRRASWSAALIGVAALSFSGLSGTASAEEPDVAARGVHIAHDLGAATAASEPDPTLANLGSQGCPVSVEAKVSPEAEAEAVARTRANALARVKAKAVAMAIARARANSRGQSQ